MAKTATADENSAPSAHPDIVQYNPEQIALAIAGIEDLPEIEDDEEAFMAFARTIASATDAEGVFRAFESTPSEDMLDIPIEVRAVRWRSSDLPGKAKCYAIVEAVALESGVEYTFATGGRSVMVGLLTFQRLGALPVRIKLTQSKRAKQGQSPALRIERV